jgi:hypothetical protein
MNNQKFSIGQSLKIKDLGPGHTFIVGILETEGQFSFNVAYWHNGERRTSWVQEFEIEVLRP